MKLSRNDLEWVASQGFISTEQAGIRAFVTLPFVLSLLGILIIFSGITYQRRQAAIEKYILDHIPDFMKKRLAARTSVNSTH